MKKEYLDAVLGKIAEGLDLPEDKERLIRARYAEVAKRFDNDPNLNCYKPIVFPQGSMALGTTVRPISGDDFDVDLVCELTHDTSAISPKHLKTLIKQGLVGHAKDAHLDKEGSRCWTLVYDAYHVDVLPAIQNGKKLKATQKDGVDYSWFSTNPVGFISWFESRAANYKRTFLEHAEIIDLPLPQDNKPPLKRFVQLAKRHRDVYFKDRQGDAPASIVITTLAGLAYKQENSIVDILRNNPIQWNRFIKRNSEGFFMNIPGYDSDNYLERWGKKYPKAAEYFFEWYGEFIRAIDNLLASRSANTFKETAERMFGPDRIKALMVGTKTAEEYIAHSYRGEINNAPTIHPLYPNAVGLSSKNIVKSQNCQKIEVRGCVNSSRSFQGSSPLLFKDDNLVFTVVGLTNEQKYKTKIYWQITNTGPDAGSDLRGEIVCESTKDSYNAHSEHVSYVGTHFVNCFLVRDGVFRQKHESQCSPTTNVHHCSGLFIIVHQSKHTSLMNNGEH